MSKHTGIIKILLMLVVVCTVLSACSDITTGEPTQINQEHEPGITLQESEPPHTNQETELLDIHENITTKLEKLRVLCIGNSHTEDYTYYLPEMLSDLSPLIRTQIQFTTAPMMGGRHLCYYMDEGEEYDPECYLKIWKDPDHPEYGAYKSLFEQGWDLIIIQDWHESTNTPEWIYPGGAPFASVLGETVSVLRQMAPGAEIAWFADWVDSENEEERKIFYQNSVDAMRAVMNLPGRSETAMASSERTETAMASSEKTEIAMASLEKTETDVAFPTETAPDYILPASTVLANARTSYLGKTKNPKDVIRNNYVPGEDYPVFSDYAGEDVSQYPLLGRDETHLSLELGRYLIGEAVLAHILNWYGERIWLENGETLTTDKIPYILANLHTDPVWEMNGSSQERETPPEAGKTYEADEVTQDTDAAFWAGEMTPELRSIILEAIYASLVSPLQITPASQQYQTDPLDIIMADMQEILEERLKAAASPSQEINISDEEILQICRDPEVLSELTSVLGSEICEDQIRIEKTEEGTEIYIDCHLGYSFASEPVMVLQ